MKSLRALLLVFALSLLLVNCGDSKRFEKAKNENTVAAYQKYLDENPRGKFVNQAKEAVESLTNKAAFERDAVELAKRCKSYFEQFRYAYDKAPSGITLLGTKFEIETLAGKANYGGPEMANAINELSRVLEPVVEENNKLLEQLKGLSADAKNFSQRFDKIQSGVGRQYIDYWIQHKAGVMVTVDAFCAEAMKLPQ